MKKFNPRGHCLHLKQPHTLIIHERKFVAVALAYQRDFKEEAPILKAEDIGWAEFKTALAVHGVHVHSICENSK